ncbi:peroxide stress protein YaaA [Ihubacter massiliensis]|uniref:UPF0246 protein OBO34_04080 n=1 Tax=Hominibacterium faecale TaxID=2839743 RepID=A0A9J6QQ21_9FIRM|nr:MULTISPECIES: peroxide stress protein YaaA [Eubacteriales Family XIII. Incertae Sedis]MCO7123272.1 peroxide stress protein YaaA [Ihubacter massiliensis]MCU7377532.1 peroxide stress protein YaaA [Hominibacterium faecale]
MKIIISPAKKMNVDNDVFAAAKLPCFLKEAKQLAAWMRALTYREAKSLWACSDKIAELNFQRFADMDLERNLTPALLSYEGIQYQYMAPKVFSKNAWDYVQEKLRILSGFYGVLRPLDGVVPYRLEMQAKAGLDGKKDLYDFWGHKLYEQVIDESRTIINLASKEYSKCIEPYLQPEDRFITCIFGEWKDGKVIQKATQAKMARGEMVRFMAENQIAEAEELKLLDHPRYIFEEGLSSEKEYVFVRKNS